MIAGAVEAPVDLARRVSDERYARLLGYPDGRSPAGRVAALVEAGLTAGWAALAVAGAFILLAAILCAKGVQILKTTTLAPTETVGELKSDIKTLKETFDDA